MATTLVTFTPRQATSSKGTWLRTGKAEAALSHIGFAGCASRASGARRSVSVTHRFLRRGLFLGGGCYFFIKRQECVLITSQTSLPGASWRESRAARVRWASISILYFTRAQTITSSCSSEVMRPGITLRALNPTGGG